MDLQGITIQLKVKTKTGENSFGEPVYSDGWVDVDDVLVGQPTTEDMPTAGEPDGRRADYVMAIPKGDTHTWTDAVVRLPEPFAGTYRTVGFPVAGIDELLPLRWNKKVKVCRAE